jgi:hypothetical protein
MKVQGTEKENHITNTGLFLEYKRIFHTSISKSKTIEKWVVGAERYFIKEYT